VSTRVTELCFDANDPELLARFWNTVLHWDSRTDEDRDVRLHPTDDTSFTIFFCCVPEPKSGKNRLHLDLVAGSEDAQAAMVDELVAAGAHPVDVGQASDADHVVLADPEGNEFCVVIRGDFLATTGVLGAVVFEPAAYEVGFFWSEATGWPIVHDENGETAIRAPGGRGPFITFGPPTGRAKSVKNRLHLVVAPPADGDRDTEVERLVARGARRIDIGQGDVSWVVLADPDGNELCVLEPQ